jgi:hypothetical protein
VERYSPLEPLLRQLSDCKISTYVAVIQDVNAFSHITAKHDLCIEPGNPRIKADTSILVHADIGYANLTK